MSKVDNKDYLWYGLYAFAGFGLEIVLLMIESLLFTEQTAFTRCLHWGVTSFLWGIVCVILYKSSKNKLQYDLICRNELEKKKQIMALLLIIITLITKFLLLGKVKVVEEFESLGPVQFVFQYIYYFFEVGLIVLTIAFGQKFFKSISESRNVPYGGLFLACTWGLMHILTQDIFTGMYTFVMSVIFGMLYVLLSKNTVYAYISILIPFLM